MSLSPSPSALRSLTSRAKVHRDSGVSWKVVHVDLPALARPMAQPRQEVQGAQAVASRQWELVFLAEADVRGGDRVEIEQRVWEVISTNVGRTGAMFLVATANRLDKTT